MRIKFSKSKAKLHPIAVEPKVLGHQVSPNIACSINQSNFIYVSLVHVYTTSLMKLMRHNRVLVHSNEIRSVVHSNHKRENLGKGYINASIYNGEV